MRVPWQLYVIGGVVALLVAASIPQVREAALGIFLALTGAGVAKQRREGRRVIHEAEQEHTASTEARNQRTEAAVAARERAEREATTRGPASDPKPVSDEERSERLDRLRGQW